MYAHSNRLDTFLYILLIFRNTILPLLFSLCFAKIFQYLMFFFFFNNTLSNPKLLVWCDFCRQSVVKVSIQNVLITFPEPWSVFLHLHTNTRHLFDVRHMHVCGRFHWTILWESLPEGILRTWVYAELWLSQW